MTDGNNTKITFRVDEDTKRRLNSGHINQSAVMRDLAKRYGRTGDTEEAALLVEREQKEDRLRDLKHQQSDIQAEIDKIEREIGRIDRRIEQRRESTSDEAAEIAEMVADRGFPRENLNEDNLAIQEKASKAGIKVSEFLYEVRQELENYES